MQNKPNIPFSSLGVTPSVIDAANQLWWRVFHVTVRLSRYCYIKCNVPSARRICDSTNWNATLGNPEKFHGLVIARVIQEQLGLLLDSSGDAYWYCLIFNKTLSRSKFGCMRCHCFDVKRERRKNCFVKFCLLPLSGTLCRDISVRVIACHMHLN